MKTECNRYIGEIITESGSVSLREKPSVVDIARLQRSGEIDPRKTMIIADRTPPEPKMKSPGEYRISMPRLVRPEKLNALKDEIAVLQATIEMNNITMARMRKERDAMINKKMEFGRYIMERTSWTNVQEGDYVFYRFTLKPSDDLDPVWRKVER